MARPSDLLKNTGSSGATPASQPPAGHSIIKPAAAANTAAGDANNITARKPDKGHNLHRGGKAQGGGGGSSARPKV